MSFKHLKSKYLIFDENDSDKQKEEIYYHELNTSKKKYFDLIYSLHDTFSLVISEPDEENITTEQLLSFILLFDKDADYTDYKNYKIGSDAVSKHEFEEWCKKINTLTNSLINKSKIALLNKLNKVEIKDVYANKDNVLSEINSILDKIYKVISKG